MMKRRERQSPSHYTVGGVEPLTVIKAWGLGFLLGNVIKYICRAGRKASTTEIEDINKAIDYLILYRQELEARSVDNR